MASQLSQDELQDTLIIDLRESVNGMWLILCGALVLFMQAGFALVEVGSVSEQNTTRIMMKNVADALAGLTVFYLVGFGIAYGKSLNGFIGISYYCVSMADPKVLGNFFFQAAFCCTSATIVSGAVAERMKFKAYVLFSSFMSAWIYPVVVHWVWGGGFLSTQAPEPIFGVGVYDFAGSGVVHMCGGTAALIGAIMVGPRYRFIDPKTGKGVVVPGSNKLHVTLGGFILWFGWFGFNAGSTQKITDGAIELGMIAACNTALGGAAGGVGVVLWESRTKQVASLGDIINGILAGLVAITAGCSVLEPLLCLVFCAFAGVCTQVFTLKLRGWLIDDPVGAVSVHLIGGWIGIAAVGLAHHQTGLFYTGKFAQLEAQLVGGGLIMLWSTVWSFFSWVFLDYTIGIRMPFFAELEGFLKTSKNFVDTCDYVEAGYFQEKQPLLSADYHKIMKFHEYLENDELSGEVLDFLLCVQHWKVMMTAICVHPDSRNPTRDHGSSTNNLTVQSGVKRRTLKIGNEQIEAILPFAFAIGDTYIRPGADLEINVSASIRKKIMKDLEHANKVGVHLMMATIFDKAALDVQIELRNGPWRRFIERYMADMTDTRIFNDVPVSWLTHQNQKRKIKMFGNNSNVKRNAEKVIVTFQVSTDALVTWRETGDFTNSRSGDSHSHSHSKDLGGISPQAGMRYNGMDDGADKGPTSTRNMLNNVNAIVDEPISSYDGREMTGLSLPANEDNDPDLVTEIAEMEQKDRFDRTEPADIDNPDHTSIDVIPTENGTRSRTHSRQNSIIGNFLARRNSKLDNSEGRVTSSWREPRNSNKQTDSHKPMHQAGTDPHNASSDSLSTEVEVERLQ